MPKIIDNARIPIRPLSYKNKNLALDNEFIIDYDNYETYVKTSDGQIHNVSTSKAAIQSILDHIKKNPDIITNANITKTDGSKVTIQNAISNLYDISLKIDSTLKVSGRAADAKIVGDALNKKSNVGHTHKASDIIDISSRIKSDLKADPAIITGATIKNGNDENTTIALAITDLYNLVKKAVSGNINVDSSLTMKGYAADAKAVGVALGKKSDNGHSHNISDINNLNNLLSGKSNNGHKHIIEDITELQESLNLKSDNGHSHMSSDITDLKILLSNKANYSHTHLSSDITDLEAKLNGKANKSHSHYISNIINLQTELDKKSDVNHTHKYAGSNTIGGPALSTIKLANSRSISVNLSSTGAKYFNGEQNISIGPTGILPISKGGTGGSTAFDGLKNLGGLPLSGGELTGQLTIPNNISLYSRLNNGEKVNLIYASTDNMVHVGYNGDNAAYVQIDHPLLVRNNESIYGYGYDTDTKFTIAYAGKDNNIHIGERGDLSDYIIMEKRMVVKSSSYGYDLPSSGIEGQVFYKLL